MAGQTAKEGIRFNFDYWENQSAPGRHAHDSGDIRASDFGIRLKKLSGGDVTLTNSGDITVTGDAAQHLGHAIYLAEGVTFGEGRTYAANGGTITVDNSGALDSKNHALLRLSGHGGRGRRSHEHRHRPVKGRGRHPHRAGRRGRRRGHEQRQRHGEAHASTSAARRRGSTSTSRGDDFRAGRGSTLRSRAPARRAARAARTAAGTTIPRSTLTGRAAASRAGRRRPTTAASPRRAPRKCSPSTRRRRREGRGGDGPLGLGRGH